MVYDWRLTEDVYERFASNPGEEAKGEALHELGRAALCVIADDATHWRLSEEFDAQRGELQNNIDLAFCKALMLGDLSRFEGIVLDRLKSNPGTSEAYQLANSVRLNYNFMRRKSRPDWVRLPERLREFFFVDQSSERNIFLNTVFLESQRHLSRLASAPNVSASLDMDHLVVLVEDLEPNLKSAVKKLIIDWIYVWLKESNDRTATLCVAKDFLNITESIIGIKKNAELEAEDIHRVIDEHSDVWSRFSLVQRGETDLQDWLITEIVGSSSACIVTFPNPLWALPAYLQRHKPMVGVELVNGMNIRRGHDIVIVNSPPTQQTEQKYGSDFVVSDFPHIPFTKERSYSKAEKYIDDKAFVVSSHAPGLVDHCNEEALHEFLNGLAELCATLPELVWVLVGSARAAYPVWFFEKLRFLSVEEKIVFIEQEPDLNALYDICDAFVMPPLKEGLRGVELAASSGLATLCVSIEEDGQSVPEELLVSDARELGLKVFRLCKDEQYREHLISESKRVFVQDQLKRAAEKLQAAREAAVASWSSPDEDE